MQYGTVLFLLKSGAIVQSSRRITAYLRLSFERFATMRLTTLMVPGSWPTFCMSITSYPFSARNSPAVRMLLRLRHLAL